MDLTRRGFMAGSAAAGALPALAQQPAPTPARPQLSAHWIWYPERRTLPGTFVLFRRVFDLAAVPPGKVEAWVTGQSRYEFFVNGRFIQRGPAPCDPRFWDIDPVDLAPHLQAGRNVIAAIVCMYGYGDGTWIPPSPVGSGEYGEGFLFEAPSLNWKTDQSWRTCRARAWKTGNYQRWFLRALQEEFDMRLWPEGWQEPGFDAAGWKPARVSRTAPGQPNLSELPPGGPDPAWGLQPRTIPMLKEHRVPAPRLSDAGIIEWKVPPEEYFECFPEDAFGETRAMPAAAAVFPQLVSIASGRSAALTFDFGREWVGHPYVRVKAPAGTVIEMLFVEQQEPGKLLLRTHPRFGQWLRLTCREGLNEFEAFEYDQFRFLQLLVRNAGGPVEILEAGINAREYPWPHPCDLQTSDAALNRVCAASLNTHELTTQETAVDNNIRERQQYAGDLDHAKLASYYAHGEVRQGARMFRTFTQGQNREGWFADCWPAWDRCQRLYQKHLGLIRWGTIIDHGLQLGIAAAEHHLFTGDRELLAEIYPRIARMDAFLWNSRLNDGLLPVEPWTWNSVWIDHIGFRIEADKHAALNLYYAGFLKQGLARLAEWSGDDAAARQARQRAEQMIQRVRSAYWDPRRRLFVDNLPRMARDGETRLHARTLSMALLFGAVAPEDEAAAVSLLAAMRTDANPDVHLFEGGKVKLGANYPLNDIWRLWALGRAGRGDAVVKDLRERYAALPSVIQNNTFAEFWDPKPSSSGNVWCQSNPVPLIAAYQILLGLRPTAPGFAEYELRPQPGGLASISATTHTVRGEIRVEAEGRPGGFTVRWRHPAGAAARFVFPAGARVRGLPAGSPQEPGPAPGTQAVRVPAAAADWTVEVDGA